MNRLINSPAFVGALLLIAILLMFVTCNKCNLGVYQPRVKTVKADTVYLTVTDSTGWIRPAIREVVLVKYRTLVRYLPGDVLRDTLLDTLRLVSDPEWYVDTTVYVYRDSLKIDTAGISGTVVIRDSSLGKIIARNISANWKLPIVTNTVTKEKGAFYFGPLAQFGNGLNAAGVSAHWKTKGPVMINGGLMFDVNGNRLYHAGAAFKISLRK